MAAFDKRKALDNALTYTKQMKWDKAIAEYQAILKADPRDLTVSNNLGDLFARAGRTSEAIDQYLKLGEQYRTDGLAVKAIAVYKKIIKLDPNRTAAFLACADLYQDQGLVGEARVQLQTVAEHYAKAGDTGKVIEVFQRLTQLDPTNHVALAKLGDLLLAEGKREAAAAEYDRAAEAAQSTGHSAESKRLFQKARDLMPESPEANLGLGELHLREGKLVEAIEALTKVTAADGSNARAWSLLGEAYGRLEQAEEAVAAFERAIAMGTPAAEVRRPLAQALVQAGRSGEAVPLCQEITEGALSEGEPDEAIAFLRGLLVAAPGAAPVHAQLVELLQGLGRDEEARAASWALAAAHEAVGETGAAIRVYRQLLERDPSDAEARARLEILEGAPAPGETLVLPATEGEPVLVLESAAEEAPAPAWLEDGAVMPPPGGLLGTETAAALELPAAGVVAPGEGGESAGIPFPMEEAGLQLLSEAPKGLGTVAAGGEGVVSAPAEGGGIEMPLVLETAEIPAPPGGTIETAAAIEGAEGIGLSADFAVPGDFLPAEAGTLAEVAPTETGPPESEPPEIAPVFEVATEDGAPAVAPLEAAPVEIAGQQPDEELPPDLRALLEESSEEATLVVEGGEADLDQTMTDDLAEAEFYLSQGMVQEAQAVQQRMQDRAPDHPAVAHLGRLLERPAEPGPGSRVSPEAPVETAEVREAPAPALVATPPAAEFPADTLAATFEALAEELAAEPPLPEMPPPGALAESAAATAPPEAPPPAVAKIPGEVEELPHPPIPPAPTAGAPPAAPVVSKFTVTDTRGEVGADFVNLGAELEEEMAAEERAATARQKAPPMQDLLKEFQKGVREHLDEKDFETHYNLGIAYKEMDLHDEAIQEFRLAARDPGRALTCANLVGLCYLAKGQTDLAIQAMEEGLSLEGHPREAYHSLQYDLGVAYQTRGDLERALELFEALEAEDARFRDVRGRVQSLRERLHLPRAAAVPAPPAHPGEPPKAPREKKKISFI